MSCPAQQEPQTLPAFSMNADELAVLDCKGDINDRMAATLFVRPHPDAHMKTLPSKYIERARGCVVSKASSNLSFLECESSQELYEEEEETKGMI
mmetsp:Transcript_26990/g.38619  ORF Transcript_26990/g.38619 Transcript_26990/m.38619 type:complete len:95 (+) Transcript_26990:814-1098(+)